MRLFLKKRAPDQIEFGMIYGGIALLMLGAGWFLPLLSLAPDCAFKGLTGIPCLTCGSTRALMHLSHGNILSALGMNPLMALCLVSAVFCFFTGLMGALLKLPRISLHFTEKEKTFLRAGAIMLLLMQWTYLIILF
jgi:hypothetical protein